MINYFHRRRLDNFNYSDDLVASWQYESNFNDYLGSHNATMSGTITNNTSGQVGNEAVFSGVTGSYLSVASDSDFFFSNTSNDLPFSMAFWMKTPSGSSSLDGRHPPRMIQRPT